MVMREKKKTNKGRKEEIRKRKERKRDGNMA